MFINRIARRSEFVVALVLLVSGTVPVLDVATASASDATAVITGKLLECGPGPIVVTPGTPAPTATPEKVVLVHRGRTYESQSIVFPKRGQWIGTFLFTVPAGKYEVISSYTGPVRWVSVKPGGRYVVGFGLIACAD